VTERAVHGTNDPRGAAMDEDRRDTEPRQEQDVEAHVGRWGSPAEEEQEQDS
jgi:hypothetical protein